MILLRGADPRDYIAHAEALSSLVLNRRPWAVVAPSTSYGKDVLARVAARLGLGLTADCIDLKVENGKVAQFKPAFGGSIVSIIYSKTYPQMATIRPGIFQPLEPNYNRSGSVEEVRISPRLTILEKRGIEFELPDPQHARIVVGVGMGFKKKENVQMAIDLAKALGGAVAATRNVVLRGWLPYYVQVGVSGKAVAPHLYIALGIRGDINHLVGIGDIFKIVPLLIERIKKM